MKQVKTMLVLFALAALLVACGGPKYKDSWPSWFDVQEEPDTYFYGFGEGVSSDANLAARQARLNAQAQLAEAFTIYVESEARQAGKIELGDVNTSGLLIDAIQARVQETITAVEQDKAERVRLPDGSTRVFVRMRMPRSQGERTGREILDEFDKRMQATRP